MPRKKKKEIRFVDPIDCATHRTNPPPVIIDFVPMIRRNVGIGYVMEGAAEVEDFRKYPVVRRPWVNESEVKI